MIWVASINPSVSLEHDLMPTVRPENFVNVDRTFSCLWLNRRGAMAASNRKFAAFNSAASFSNSPARSFASPASLFMPRLKVKTWL